jgi:UDP-4-amino-4,6-dideoxy-N-acetyl-beta-L-altrosamine transaminase
MPFIPYGRQTISDDDIDAVVSVLRSDFLTQGPQVPKFEKAVADYCNVAHAVAVNSATSALHIACLALDLGPGDWLWTTPNTFVASANCGRYCGASVDFVDIDPVTFNMSVSALSEKLAKAKIDGKLPKIVVPVHFSGLPCDMKAIHDLSKVYGFRIIEDASHAIGASYLDGKVGNCAYCDITVFSFHPVKIITTAEGGMATTRSADLATKMQDLRSHGITRDTKRMTRPDEGPWYYEQQSLGLNYRMTDMQAALGTAQMQHLDPWVARRHAIADVYDRKLAHLPLILPQRSQESMSALHLYVIQVDETKTRATRRQVFDALRAAQIGVNVHYIPVHQQPDFVASGFGGSYPASETYYNRCISIPMYSGLSDVDQQFVIETLENIFSGKDAAQG